MNKEEIIKRIKSLDNEVAKLKDMVNTLAEPKRWQDELLNPKHADLGYYCIDRSIAEGFIVRGITTGGSDRKPEHAFLTEEQAELVKNKILLMQEMHAFAYARNDNTEIDWKNMDQVKWGIFHTDTGFRVSYEVNENYFVFGVVVKSKELAEEMLEEFGERIEAIHNKQY